MSALSVSAFPATSRRTSQRRVATPPQLVLVADVPRPQPQPVVPSQWRRQPIARREVRLGDTLALAAVVVAVHAAVIWFALQAPAGSTALPQPHAVAIEIARPLPQAELPPPSQKEAPPPPRARAPAPTVQQKALPKREDVPAATPVVAVPVAEKAVEADSAAPSSIVAIAEPAPAPVPEKITEAFGKAGYLNNPPPAYPEFAQEQGWEGRVILKVRVLASGRADSVEVQRSSGRKLLDEAAVKTVRGWLFAPSRRGTTLIDGWASVPIEFRLAQ